MGFSSHVLLRLPHCINLRGCLAKVARDGAIRVLALIVLNDRMSLLAFESDFSDILLIQQLPYIY
jgi:hypothetical protein